MSHSKDFRVEEITVVWRWVEWESWKSGFEVVVGKRKFSSNAKFWPCRNRSRSRRALCVKRRTVRQGFHPLSKHRGF